MDALWTTNSKQKCLCCLYFQTSLSFYLQWCTEYISCVLGNLFFHAKSFQKTKDIFINEKVKINPPNKRITKQDFFKNHSRLNSKNVVQKMITRHLISPDPIGGVGESPKSTSSSLSAKVSAQECSAASSSPVVTIVSAQLYKNSIVYY